MLERRLKLGMYIVTGALVTGATLAQEANSDPEVGAEAAPGLEEVVVTARKREESVRDVPVAITALTELDIERADIRGLDEIAAATAGLQYSDQGGQTPGRVDSAIRFRGMHVNSTAPSRQVGGMFIDGSYILGSTHSIPLDDVERVEVIKGPQSAYFGRNTFGGAVNYITKTPSLVEHTGKVSALGASFDEYEAAASYEGPLLQDRLGFRVGVRSFSRGAMYTASDGGRLGEQSSQSAYITLLARPTEALSLRLRGFYAEDDDGPAAGALIAGVQNDSCSGRTITTNAGEVSNPRRYICGAAPTIDDALPIMGVGRIIDANNSLFPIRAFQLGIPNVLPDQLINRPLPAGLEDVPSLRGFGLRRDVSRLSLSVDYALGDYVVTAQAAYSDLAQVSVRDYGPAAFDNWYVREARSQSDKSAELRIASPTEGRLRWVAGVNAYTQDYLSPNANGDVVVLCIDTANATTDPPDSRCLPTSLRFNHDVNNDSTDGLGVFAAATYKITDLWTLSAEGRYQKDENTQGATRRLTVDYENFLPRVILQFQPNRSSNFYASYSLGSLPGAVNQRVVDATPYELSQYERLFPGATGFTAEEELTSYELGWKQSLFDGRFNFALATYYGTWENQKSQVSAIINETCRAITIGTLGCRPALGEGNVGEPARAADGTPAVFSRGLTIAGSSEIYGAELEGQFVVNASWSGGFSIGYAGSEYEDFLFFFVLPIAGVSDMRGNTNPRFPDWSGSLNGTYERSIGESSTFYARGDLFYTGRTFADESNLAFCEDYVTANARLGIERERLRLEAFVRNLFDEDAWAACSRWTDFENPTNLSAVTANQGIAATPLDKRQFGLRMAYRF